MATTRDMDIQLLKVLSGLEDLTSDQLDGLLFARGLQMVVEDLMALALDALVMVYVNDEGAIMIMGAEGEPIKLSELVIITLSDEALSLFGDDTSYDEEGEDYAESSGHEETVLH